MARFRAIACSAGRSLDEAVTSLAPLALFVFRRPEHTRHVLDALGRCPEFAETPLYIFADGPRHSGDANGVAATRELVARFVHPRKQLIFAEANQGLARSIIGGVATLCREHEKAIVLEDDLIVSPAFLAYMNHALARYEAEPRVWSVNAFSFGNLGPATGGKAFFLPYAHPWGWATWLRSWEAFDPSAPYLEIVTATRQRAHRFNLNGADDYVLMLRRQECGELDSWWIRWYAASFLAGALGLFPPAPLIRSIGSDPSATHRQFSERLLQPAMPTLGCDPPALPAEVGVDQAAYRRYRAAMRPRLRRALRFLGSVKRALAHA